MQKKETTKRIMEPQSHWDTTVAWKKLRKEVKKGGDGKPGTKFNQLKVR